MSAQIYPQLVRPYRSLGSFSDSTTQALTTSVVNYVKFNTTELQQGVLVKNDGSGFPTRLLVQSAGVYAFAISPQLVQGSGGAADVDFWAAVDGVDVPRSASRISLPNNTKTLPYLELIVTMSANSALQWAFYTPGTGVSIYANAAAAPVPAAPSVICTVKQLQ